MKVKLPPPRLVQPKIRRSGGLVHLHNWKTTRPDAKYCNVRRFVGLCVRSQNSKSSVYLELAIAFAQMRRAVCQRQLSILYIVSVLVLTSEVTL